MILSKHVNKKELKAKMVQKYGSQSEFAKVWGKKPSYVSAKLNERIAMTFDDMVEWAMLLDIEDNDIGSSFFCLETSKIL